MNAASALSLLERIHECGISLTLHGDAIKYRAPRSELTPELRKKIGSHKTELLALLGEPRFAESRSGVDFAVPRYKDWWWNEIKHERIGVAYTNSTCWAHMINAPIDIDRLEDSLHRLTDRHPILSAGIVLRDGLHRFSFDRPVRLMRVNLKGESRLLDETLTELLWRPFDVERDPFFRPFIVQVSDHRYVVGFVCHHYVCDGWSSAILIRDWLGGYDHNSVVANEKQSRPYQFPDYLAAMEQWCSSPAVDARLEYWKQHLHGAGAGILPMSTQADRDAWVPFGKLGFGLPKERVALLRTQAASLKVTPVSFVVAAKVLALCNALRTDEITFRLMDNGRHEPALLEMVGSTENPIPVRIRVDPDETFAAAARRLQAACQEAHAMALPLGLVASTFDSFKALDLHAGINAMDIGDEAPANQPIFSLFEHSESIRTPEPTLMQRLKHHPAHSMSVVIGEGMQGQLLYLEGFYTRTAMAAFIDSFLSILERAIRDTSMRLRDLGRHSDAKRRGQVVEWSATAN
jgi:hypothetical protein